jgi:hypothetical protein
VARDDLAAKLTLATRWLWAPLPTKEIFLDLAGLVGCEGRHVSRGGVTWPGKSAEKGGDSFLGHHFACIGRPANGSKIVLVLFSAHKKSLAVPARSYRSFL